MLKRFWQWFRGTPHQGDWFDVSQSWLTPELELLLDRAWERESRGKQQVVSARDRFFTLLNLNMEQRSE